MCDKIGGLDFSSGLLVDCREEIGMRVRVFNVWAGYLAEKNWVNSIGDGWRLSIVLGGIRDLGFDRRLLVDLGMGILGVLEGEMRGIFGWFFWGGRGFLG